MYILCIIVLSIKYIKLIVDLQVWKKSKDFTKLVQKMPCCPRPCCPALAAAPDPSVVPVSFQLPHAYFFDEN
jgi:hypothetical protein